MCRLFGLLGAPVTQAAPWLLEGDRSFLAQAHASEETAQKDGWGIAWYDARRTPRIDQGIRGAFEATERPRFEQAARAAHGPVVLAHLRHASNPMGLPHSRLIALENCQPFTHDGALFVHNGEISLPREIRPRLGRFEERVRGVNDSEILFWLFTNHLQSVGDPVSAYVRARADLEEVWREQGMRPNLPYTGLNVIYSRGPNELWAFCHWRGDHGGGLLDTEAPYYQMGYESDAKTVVVGSEPFSAQHPGWRRLENNHYLAARVEHGLVGVKTAPIA